MLTDTEATRLAEMATALRPDWPTASLRTHIRNHHATRTYRDLAVALAYIGTDAATRTPARLLEHGPWWQTTAEDRTKPVGQPPRCPEHPPNPVTRCPECAAITPATPEQITARRAQARATIRGES